MIARRAFIAAAGAAVVASPSLGPAQTHRELRVGILSSDNEKDPRVTQIREGLQSLGYAENRNLVIDFRWADGDIARTDSLAAELIAGHPDVIVTLGFAVFAVKRQTSTVPIVVAFSGDLVTTGIVSDLARPGGNVTGLSLMSTDLAAKRLQLLKEAFPRTTRVGILYTHEEVAALPELHETESAAGSLGIALQPLDTPAADRLEDAFAAAARAGADGFIVFAHSFAYRNRLRIIDLVKRSGRPALYGWRQFVEAGGLMSYGPDVLATVRRAAIYVDRIAKGTKPGDMPVEQPSTFELAVNARTASDMHLAIAPPLLSRADRVFS